MKRLMALSVVFFLLFNPALAFADDSRTVNEAFDRLDVNAALGDAAYEPVQKQESFFERIVKRAIPATAVAAVLASIFSLMALARHRRQVLPALIQMTRRRTFRYALSVYLGWVAALWIFSQLGLEYFDPDHALFLLIAPPALVAGGFVLFQWCRRGA